MTKKSNNNSKGGAKVDGAGNSEEHENDLNIMDPKYHDFYNIKKDGEKVFCLYDSHMAQEKIELQNLTNREMSYHFKVRGQNKNIPDSKLAIKIPISKLGYAEEQIMSLRKPYVYQNLRRYMATRDLYDSN